MPRFAIPRARARLHGRVCWWRTPREEGGERNRCTRQRDADRRGSFSFFSPLRPPPAFGFPPLRSRSLSRPLARGIFRCQLVFAAITARSARLYLRRDAGTNGSEGCRSRMFDHPPIRCRGLDLRDLRRCLRLLTFFLIFRGPGDYSLRF